MTAPIGSLASFWVVLKPTIRSVIADICFEATPQSIGDLFLGGFGTLTFGTGSRYVVVCACGDVYGFYLEEDVARDAARVLLRALWPPGSTLPRVKSAREIGLEKESRRRSRESLDNKSTDTLD